MTPAKWTERHPEEKEPIEWSDDKPEERVDRFVTTEHGDMDIFSRPMRQGS